MSWKKRCRKIIQLTSTAGAPSAAISQSSTATGAKSRHMMLPMRESPQLSTVRSFAGRFASSHAKACSMIG